MQEMQHPDGTISREFFTDDEMKRGKMRERRRELQAQGYTVTRIAYIMKPSRYMPHQGSGEIARRLRQMQRDEANRIKRAEREAETC